MKAEQPATAGDGAEASATEAATTEGSESEKTAKKTPEPKILLGVIRVGLFAKRIMLDGDLLAELVVVCTEKPLTSLLRRVATLMANEMAVIFLTSCELYSLCGCITLYACTNIRDSRKSPKQGNHGNRDFPQMP